MKDVSKTLQVHQDTVDKEHSTTHVQTLGFHIPDDHAKNVDDPIIQVHHQNDCVLDHPSSSIFVQQKNKFHCEDWRVLIGGFLIHLVLVSFISGDLFRSTSLLTYTHTTQA